MLKNKDCAKYVITICNSTKFRKTVLLGCIYKWQQNALYVSLGNDCSIRVYQTSVAIFQTMLALCLTLSVIHYTPNYAGTIGWSLHVLVKLQ